MWSILVYIYEGVKNFGRKSLLCYIIAGKMRDKICFQMIVLHGHNAGMRKLN